MISVGGITNWENLDHLDYPMPEAVAIVLGRQNPLTKFFTSVGLFGLIASFHGIMISYSRQIFALARAGYFAYRIISRKQKTASSFSGIGNRGHLRYFSIDFSGYQQVGYSLDHRCGSGLHHQYAVVISTSANTAQLTEIV